MCPIVPKWFAYILSSCFTFQFRYIGLCPSFVGKALQGGDRFWCFFTRRKQNRADKIIICSNKDAAMKKTLRYYYIGQPPEGIKTNRVMHRYHLLDGILGSSPSGGSSSSTSTRGKRRRAVCTYYYHASQLNFYVRSNSLPSTLPDLP